MDIIRTAQSHLNRVLFNSDSPADGPLSSAAQAALAKEYENVGLDECYVYHWFDTPDGKTIPGVWDLRTNWFAYIGDTKLDRKTVLEIGPASGFLTFKMEEMGAKVTCFDVAPGVSPDVMPVPKLDHEKLLSEFANNTRSVRAAWWYFHKIFRSKSKAVYGNIYHLPQDIGSFDVSTIGAVLLHLANPFAALTQIARLTKETIIITDLHDKRLDGGAFMEVNPHRGSSGPMAWWLISPQAVVHMLHANGFEPTSITFNNFNNYPTQDPSTFQTHSFFTIVARRTVPMTSN